MGRGHVYCPDHLAQRGMWKRRYWRGYKSLVSPYTRTTGNALKDWIAVSSTHLAFTGRIPYACRPPYYRLRQLTKESFRKEEKIVQRPSTHMGIHGKRNCAVYIAGK